MDMAALKENAIAWRHPEIGVTTSIAVTHNYFSPVDCEEQVDNQLLTDLVNLKRSALEWRGEAVPVKVDPCVTARCFFDRASAMSGTETEERAQVLADARALKEAVVAYRHPEVGVTSNGVQARCYFDRASADMPETSEEMEYRAQVLADVANLKSQAMAYRHPEVGVTSNGLSSRNYFTRNVYDDKIHSEPALLKSEDDYAHFDLDEDSQHEEHHDDFEEFKASIRINLPDVPFKKTNLATDEEEGSLSRSPSSVMLFGLESGA